jgi:hypothetical protein
MPHLPAGKNSKQLKSRANQRNSCVSWSQWLKACLKAFSQGDRSEPLETAVSRAHICAMDALTLQLMTWVCDRPRTYGEVMEAWTTTCPKMPIWEDAVSDGLVRVEGEGGMRERAVRLTQRGRALLNGHS